LEVLGGKKNNLQNIINCGFFAQKKKVLIV